MIDEQSLADQIKFLKFRYVYFIFFVAGAGVREGRHEGCDNVRNILRKEVISRDAPTS